MYMCSCISSASQNVWYECLPACAARSHVLQLALSICGCWFLVPPMNIEQTILSADRPILRALQIMCNA